MVGVKRFMNTSLFSHEITVDWSFSDTVVDTSFSGSSFPTGINSHSRSRCRRQGVENDKFSSCGSNRHWPNMFSYCDSGGPQP